MGQMYATQANTIGTINQEEIDRMVGIMNERHKQLLSHIRTDLGVTLPLSGVT